MSALREYAVSELSVAEDILVPVKKLWKAYGQRNPDVSLEEFTADLKDDDRIEFVYVDDTYPNWDADEIAEHEAAMEEVGWFSGPRVKLKSRIITLEHALRMLAKHSGLALDNLVDAYEARPEELSEQAQRELFEVIERTAELQRKVRSEFPGPTP